MSGFGSHPRQPSPIDLDNLEATNLIEAQWQSFRDQVIPMGAPQVQIEEMRRAFFGGAAAVGFVFNDYLATDASAEDVAKVLPAIAAECDRFGNRLMQNAASRVSKH